MMTGTADRAVGVVAAGIVSVIAATAAVGPLNLRSS
jgi:hypothetical protein